jgi:hypothetical protein
MCRALKVLCAAPGRDELAKLRRAVVSVNWELVGGATTLADLDEQVRGWSPDVVVVDGSFGPEAVELVRGARPSARIVAVGEHGKTSHGGEGPDEWAGSLEDIRNVVLGMPRPGGPVRT